MIPHEPPHERPHGPHRPEPWGAPEPHPEAPWRGPAPWGPYYMGRAFGPWWEPWYERSVPATDDQLPLISHVGRGLRGNGYKVRIASDDDNGTYLEGLEYDAASKTWTSEWLSENINGGKMTYQYNFRPFTDPKTFTITFRYTRPGREEWAWTTPAIPYVLDTEDDADSFVATGAASFFLKKTSEDWILSDIPTSHTIAETEGRQEKLLYPNDWLREQLNAPLPGDPWTINLEYGVGGDIDAPNTDDLAKILGITVQQIQNIIADDPDELNVMDHIHADMGFDEHLIGDDNDVVRNTIKKYIDGLRWDIYYNLGVPDPSTDFYDETNGLETPDGDPLTYTPKHGPNAGTPIPTPDLKTYIDARCDDLEDGLADIINNIAGAVIDPDTGRFSLPAGTKIASGDINLYSGMDEAHVIRTHDDPSADHDVKAV